MQMPPQCWILPCFWKKFSIWDMHCAYIVCLTVEFLWQTAEPSDEFHLQCLFTCLIFILVSIHFDLDSLLCGSITLQNRNLFSSAPYTFRKTKSKMLLSYFALLSDLRENIFSATKSLISRAGNSVFWYCKTFLSIHSRLWVTGC